MTDLYLKQIENEFVSTGPAWLQKLRKEAIGCFGNLGFPSVDQEQWRYTNLQPLADSKFKLIQDYKSEGLTPDKFENLKHLPLNPMDGCDLIFINGRFSPEFSSLPELPKGVLIKSLFEALRDQPELVEPYLARFAKYQTHPFVALNTAFIRDGAFLFVPKGVVLKNPIHLLFISKPNGEATVSHPRNLIIAEAHSQVAIIESYVGMGSSSYLTNTVTEIIAEEGAVVDHYKLQGESKDAFHMASLAVHQGRQSKFNSHSVSIGGLLVRNDLGTCLDAEGAECTLNGLYLGMENQLIDNHTIIDHAKPHGTSSELYKGILSGKAHAVFNGKILVREGAQKTQARQTNKNLLLSDDAVIDTEPLLEIFNNDVKCNHGATIGRLDENQIFYLRSRGISKTQARNILTCAFVGDVIAQMKIESIRVRLEELISLRLMRDRRISEVA